MKPRNTIHTATHFLLITACDEECANIQVGVLDEYRRYQYQSKGQVSFRVTLPDFKREWKRVLPGEMTAEEFDRVLRENKAKVLEKIEELNCWYWVDTDM